MQQKPEISPELDGVTHINVSYLAKTPLGKLLNDSSPLTYPYVDDAGTVHEFTAYGYLAFLLTGKKDYHLAGAEQSVIRKHMSESTIRWTREVTVSYREALKYRVSYAHGFYVYAMMYNNKLPFVSYTLRDGRVVMRKNDRVLVNFYNAYKLPPLTV